MKKLGVFDSILTQYGNIKKANDEIKNSIVTSSKDNVTKKPWDRVLLDGNVEADSLYGTIIGGDVLPFGYKRVRPVVTPLTMEGDKLVLMKSKDDRDDATHINGIKV